ncbi:MAG: hypothetical protein NTY39_06570 [Campylobacterales bacterium]|nr:hypothetical protein [Campylobacterales bacterium]
MKLVKMSIAAAVLLGASAFAIDNVKVDGDAKLYYYTHDQGKNVSVFDKGSSAADTAIRLGVTGDLMKGVSFGLTGNAVSTLGLENNLVANTWTGAHTLNQTALAAGKVDVKDQAWMSEAWLATTMGKTTVKLGRMALDTPLAFSETWSVAPNTFEAAVLINQDLPDTTLVGAWVGKGNGVNALSPLSASHNNAAQVGVDGFMGMGASFGTFIDGGAYAAAAVNNSLKFLTAQAWYYNVVNVADAFWLQADWDCQLVKDAKLGVQYANISTKGLAAPFHDSSAYAVKAAYNGVQNLKVSAAYSEADKDGALKIANVATNNLAGAQSKLYTEAYWSYGYVGAAGAKTVTVAGEYDAGVAQLGAYYTNVNNSHATGDLQEATLSAAKDFGPLNATVAYINTKLNGGDNYNAALAMLKLKF